MINRPILTYIAAGAILLGSAVPAVAQATQAPAPQQVFVEANPDARQTREDLKELLNRYPPSLGRVLKLDSSLMMNDGYLATYPQLAAFQTASGSRPQRRLFLNSSPSTKETTGSRATPSGCGRTPSKA
jgi:hypothetical protein